MIFSCKKAFDGVVSVIDGVVSVFDGVVSVFDGVGRSRLVV